MPRFLDMRPTQFPTVPRLVGAASVMARIRRLQSPEAEKRIGGALFAAGEMLATEAQVSITRGSQSGKGHVPSRPGEPPMNDTGFLAAHIETTQPKALLVEVSANAPYARALEFGTSRMAERPFMRPAAALIRSEADNLVAQVVSRELKRKL